MDKLLFDFIYGKSLPEYKKDSMFKYLNQDFCSFIECSHSLDKLLTISGTNIFPQLCEEKTIRCDFGEGLVYFPNNIVIVKNAIHRPKSLKQNYFESKYIKHYLNF